MKHIKNQAVTLMVLVWISTIGLCAEPFAKGPYLGQNPPGPTPQVFAPGLICQAGPNQWEGNGSFSADGNTFCFQGVGGTFITENTDQGWTAPELIRSIPGNSWVSCLSPDANSIFFTIAESHPWNKHYDLFRCNRTTDGWSKPQRLGPPLSSPGRENCCSIPANNNIYLCSGRKRPEGGSWIWIIPFVDNTWSQAVNVTLDHPRACCPGIAPDESFMVIYSIRPGTVPGTETNLYITLRRADGTWTKPKDMGPKINTKYYEHGPRISPDKKYLFFNRCEGWDPRIYTGDIYWVELKEYLPESYRASEDMVKGQIGSMKRRSATKQISGIDSVQEFEEPIAKGPYLGQTPPGSTAKVFAPGLICDTRPGQWESHGHFSTDGNTFCFIRRKFVYITENTDQGWTIPKYIESIPYENWSPCLSPDANSLYFVAPYNRLHRHNLFRCTRTSSGWTIPQKLGPPLSSSGCEWSFSLTADNSFYLASSRIPKGIWYIPYVNNTWPEAIYVPSVNTPNYNEAHPGIAPDESFMVFNDAFRPGGHGYADLYLILRNPDGTWSQPRNLGPKINSSYIEFGARISPDKKYLFFTRSTGWNLGPDYDTADIYWVELKEYLPESYR